ncbi:hypothetical protein D4764_06G0011590 [Takifugu flavidus]|uniref:Uncharacterized protein n=1 Tax=Takifugu flavidus TaxID=433684 RepID=A0A5C6MXT0_9TELE|nr:hypothetical protein D4764_06G0011590 [Takifugu flavidus]
MDHSCSSSSVLDSGGLEVLGSTKQSSTDVSTGSFDFHRDPPAQCHGAQTDPPVPALRFCGQLAQWTGNSTTTRSGRARHPCPSPGEVASSRLELRNEGNTSIFYSWQQLDVSSSLSHLLSTEGAAASTSTSPQVRVILPGVTQQIDLMFKSGVPGLHTESWQLHTNPVLLQGASVQVTLMGFAVSEDRTAELRRHLEVSRSEKDKKVGKDPADQSLGRDFADDQTFTDFTPFEEEACSAAFGSFSGSTSPM